MWARFSVRSGSWLRLEWESELRLGQMLRISQKQNMVFQPFQGEPALSCEATDAGSFRNLLSHPQLAALTI